MIFNFSIKLKKLNYTVGPYSGNEDVRYLKCIGFTDSRYNHKKI